MGRGAAIGLWALSLGSLARGDARLSSHADRIGALALAQLAAEVGDLAIAHGLDARADRESGLVAVRAAAFAREPERLVPALVAIACGRDPVLAPEAGLTLWSLAETVTLARLAEREALLSDVRAAHQALADGCELPPRADIAQMLELTAQHLAHVLSPE
jgi:hypothetical protein